LQPTCFPDICSIQVRARACVFMCVRARACSCACARACVCVYARMHVCVRVCVRAHAHRVMLCDGTFCRSCECWKTQAPRSAWRPRGHVARRCSVWRTPHWTAWGGGDVRPCLPLALLFRMGMVRWHCRALPSTASARVVSTTDSRHRLLVSCAASISRRLTIVQAMARCESSAHVTLSWVRPFLGSVCVTKGVTCPCLVAARTLSPPKLPPAISGVLTVKRRRAQGLAPRTTAGCARMRRRVLGCWPYAFVITWAKG
jgi:hypothetical protein